ncbi:unnamed protein product [Thelazia callipaeda]|uniref:SUZ domain-containing protein n=1 Tax=Thelazia callipaeda TaxID=103827 RepID=A0A0N5D4F4_THECL|nr:unnamed protein product [Thelazia callipaeda]
MTALSHSKMFSQVPFLHENMLMEREERLSEQEKQEARMLYEREKQIYKSGEFDHNDWRFRSSNIVDNELDGSSRPFPRMWPSALQQNPSPSPLRPTPMAMILERAMDYPRSSESSEHQNANAIQIITDRVTLPSGIFIRSLRGDVFDARGTVYDLSRYKAKKENNSHTSNEVIDLCDSD